MKRGASGLPENAPLPRKPKAVVSLDDLLKEVFNQNYDKFREYLSRENITTLNLSGRGIGDDNLKYLFEALKDTGVMRVNLRDNGIGDEGAKALAEGIKGNNTLTTVYLSFNQIGDEGVKALAEGIKGNNTLTVIYLDCNQIGDKGAKALAEGIEGNNTLTTVALGGNQIGDEGAKALAKGIKGNNTLTTVYLGWNHIRDEGAKALAEGIKGNNTLTKVNLLRNQIGDKGANALADAIPDTRIIRLKLSITNLKLQDALTLNLRKQIISPYSAVSLLLLPEEEKAKYSNLRKLTDNPSLEEELQYAGGILMRLPGEVACRTLSFLPLMTHKTAEKYLTLAKKEYPEGLKIDDNQKEDPTNRQIHSSYYS